MGCADLVAVIEVLVMLEERTGEWEFDQLKKWDVCWLSPYVLQMP